MENENNDKLKEMINNLVCISKEKDLEIMDLKEKLKRERYNKRFERKKYKLIEYENMVLMNKLIWIKILFMFHFPNNFLISSLFNFLFLKITFTLYLFS